MAGPQCTARALLLCLGLGLCACSSDTASPGVLSDSGAGSDATDGGGSGLGDDFFVGLEKTAGPYTVRWIDGEPAPPNFGDNRWVVELTDSTGPVLGAQLSVSSWMPEHGHPSVKQTLVTELGEGRYELNPIYLQMPGIWEVTLSIASETEDPVNVLYIVSVPET